MHKIFDLFVSYNSDVSLEGPILKLECKEFIPHSCGSIIAIHHSSQDS